MVAIQVGQASRLASDWESGRVVGALQWSRAVWSKIDTGRSDTAAGGICDFDWEIVSINEGD